MRVRRITRSPAVFWLSAAALTVLTASTAAHLVAHAQAEAARFGRLRPVAVAVRPVPVGRRLAPSDVTVRHLPTALLPAGALASAAVGRTVIVPLVAGEPVLRSKVAPSGVRGVAALLPRDTRGVTVPRGPSPAPVRRGDVVDVLASFDPSSAGEDAPTFAVATGALVVDVAEDSVTVAVTPDEAPKVAFAATNGAVTLALDHRAP